MSIEALRKRVLTALNKHPDCMPNPIGNTSKLLRFLVGSRTGLGVEPRGQEHLNIWIELNSFDPKSLSEIDHVVYRDVVKNQKGGNASILTAGAFSDSNLVRLKVKTITDAERIISAATSRLAAP